MDCGLHEASLTGNTAALLRLLEKDSLLLDRPFSDGETPLHIAAVYGHVEFSETLLCLRPKLASALDSGRRSPLHLASMRGHVGIVKLLLQMDPAMCLARDQDGMTPLHAAALKGRVEVVKEIVNANKLATRVLTTNSREPILHVCVNHGRFDVAKALLECARDDGDDELLKMKDDDDNTILHVTAAKKHIPLTKFLLRETTMKEEVNALNVNGYTALDMFLQNRNKSSNDVKLEGILRGSKARKSSLMPLPKDVWMVKAANPKKDRRKKHVEWLKDTRSALMIVAILIATVTYQAGFNPAGGLWQEDDKIKGHLAGQSVMASTDPWTFTAFTICNSVGFISSLMIILLLISGIPLKSRIFTWALMIITWIAVSSMILTYSYAVSFTASPDRNSLDGIMPVWYMRFTVLFPLLFIAVHILRIIIKWCRMMYTMTKRGVISIDM